jgi:hypothetical protein
LNEPAVHFAIRPSAVWLSLLLGWSDWVSPVTSSAYGQERLAPISSDAAPGGTAVQSPTSQVPGLSTPSPTLEDEALLQEEVGDRDPTYLRTHLIARYDVRVADGPITTNRVRLKLQYAFGARQRFGVSALLPYLRRDTPPRSASGAGDTEVQASVNVYRTERVRTGGTLQETLRTASDPLVWGASTLLKPSWALTAVFSSHFELTSAIYYARSIRTVRGMPARQVEPDITANVGVGRTTCFVESDSFYDLIPGRFAPTLKAGISDAFGHDQRWVVNGYYSVGLNDYARRSQYGSNVGLDLTWFPFKYR